MTLYDMKVYDMKVELRKADNGWILEGNGGDSLPATILCMTWDDVVRELEKWFNIKQRPLIWTKVDTGSGGSTGTFTTPMRPFDP